MTQRVLTGITPSGTPHLGNYAGAIRPAVRASAQPDSDAFFFLADYHALIKCEDPQRVARSRLEIAATWLAAGLDPDKVTFYRQSDIPEILELSWMLTCITNKGLMNRAHAYKAAVDQNIERGVEPDDGINMGLYSYPILMAADILMFNAHLVPVGRDQIQHIEMARDIAQRFDHLYGTPQGKTFFTLPYELIDESVATLPGLDGRKMSKSYDNTVPLFEGGEKALRAAINRIVTDSKQPGEPKDPDCHLFELYEVFATPEQSAAFAEELKAGLAWGEAKKQLFECINAELAPMREKYNELMANPAQIEAILQAGAAKARQISAPLMEELRYAVGLRGTAVESSAPKAKREKAKAARFVSFKGEEGFQFRLFDADDKEVFLSLPFANPKEAGLLIKQLQAGEYRLDAAEGGQQLYVGTVLIAVLDVEQQDRLIAALSL